MITEAQARKRGMSDIEIGLGFLFGEVEPDAGRLTPGEKIHGKVIGGRFEAYHNVTVYEDGYEEWDYIGD